MVNEILPFLNIDIPVTFKDQPGVMSAVLYTKIDLCNLNCYQCHNRILYQGEKSLVTKENLLITTEKLSEKLDKLRNLGVRLIVISGGEPTIMPKLENGLKFLKDNNFDVRLDSNGTNPDKLESLINDKLIDGLAIDCKVPIYDGYTEEELRRFKIILFSDEDESDKRFFWYVNNWKKTFALISQNKDKLRYILFRTVEYPFLTNKDKKYIKNFVKPFDYQLNPFYSIDKL